MVETSFNLFDLIVLAVVGLSALLSFFRGFIREVLSLGAWVGAAIITLYAFPHVHDWVRPQVNSDMVASGIASMGTFMGALIIISIFTRLIGKYVKSGADVGVLDNILGLGFGAARGLLVICIGYFILTKVMTEENYPEWIKTAKTQPFIKETTSWLAKVAPDYIGDLSPNPDKNGTDTKADDEDSTPRILKPKAEDDANTEEGLGKWESLDELKTRMGVE